MQHNSRLVSESLGCVLVGLVQDLRDSEELNNFSAAAAELQLVNINDLGRIQLLAFFLNAYNLMVLHAHVVRNSTDGTDFKAQRIPFTRDNQYMIAAYNYSLAEIEERLFCRVLRAKYAACFRAANAHLVHTAVQDGGPPCGQAPAPASAPCG